MRGRPARQQLAVTDEWNDVDNLRDIYRCRTLSVFDETVSVAACFCFRVGAGCLDFGFADYGRIDRELLDEVRTQHRLHSLKYLLLRQRSDVFDQVAFADFETPRQVVLAKKRC